MKKTQRTSRFVYEGWDRNGQKRQGEITGTSRPRVKAALRRDGLVRFGRLSRKRPELRLLHGRVTNADITAFTRQFATLTTAGVPLIRAFDIIIEGLEKTVLIEQLSEVKRSLSSGSSLAHSFRRQPETFTPLYCSLIAAGEQAGALESMLDRLALYLEKAEQVRRQVSGAMKYPLVVLIVSLLVSAVLLLKVVPTFAALFSNFGASLPAPTRIVIGLSNWLQSHWPVFAVSILLLFFTARQLLRHSIRALRLWQRLLIALPVIGPVLRLSAIARYARTLSTTFAAGVPLTSALESTAKASGNLHFTEHILSVRRDVETGTELAVAMRQCSVFPAMLTQMVGIGEQSGTLDQMLARAATLYEAEVDHQVEALTTLMEPLIMSVLGLLVGGLVVSMYLPVFRMGSVIG